ncbi:MAG: RCC1 domain-containing protein [Roseiflexaceae bacterium]
MICTHFFVSAPVPAHASSFPGISTGNGFGCVIKDGQVWCWGENRYGQLGDRTTTTRTGAVRTQKNNGNQLNNVTKISSFFRHTCAISGGQVWCWGDNRNGQLGDNTTTMRTGAVQVRKSNGQVLNNVTHISVGDYHSCAVSNQTAWCWGRNDSGQLGNRTTTDQLRAVQVLRANGAILDQVSSVEAGASHTCAIRAATVWCWGNNGVGQLGDNTTTSRTGAVPAKQSATTNLTNVSMIAVGEDTSCAIQNRQVKCWGLNNKGQIGDNTNVNRYVATASKKTNNQLLNNATAITTNSSFSCAVNNGELWCWGSNSKGKLGDRTLRDNRRAVRVINANGNALTGATQVTAGDAHACAIIGSKPWCWGDMTNSATSVRIPLYKKSVAVKKQSDNTNLNQPQRVTSGGDFSCTSDTSNYIWCWGLNSSGQLGDKTFVAKNGAVQVYRSDNALLRSNLVRAGAESACAIDTTKQVWCWGKNDYGQLGDGTRTNRNKAVQVRKATDNTPLGNAIDLTVGNQHACAITESRTAFCWGFNGSGQVGDGTTNTTTKAVQVLDGASALANVQSISAGYQMTCAAIGSNKNVKCWGENSDGQLGDTTTTASLTPVQTKTSTGANLTNVTMLSSGISHTCAVVSNTSVHCWGNNSYGQIGNGTTTNQLSATPAQFSNGSAITGSAVRVGVGFGSSCATIRTGTQWRAYCWGYNAFGQLSDNSLRNRTRAVPFFTNAGTTNNIGYVAPGDKHICASEVTYTFCGGSNTLGQIGNKGNITPLGAMRIRYANGSQVE